MLDTLAPWIAQGGAVGILGLFVLAILTGRLVPRRVLEDAVAAERRRGDEAMAAWRAADERADLLVGQVDKLLGYAQTADHVLRALPRPSDVRDGAA